MTSIRSGYLRLDLVEDAGWVIEDDEPVVFRLWPQPKPQTTHFPALLGRRDEFDFAARAVRAGAPLEYYAPCGYGRTTLLRHLAAGLPRVLGVPAVFLDTRGQPPADVSQRVLHDLLATSQPIRATPAEARQLLARIAPLVLLDDVAWNVEDTERALDELAGCPVILASDRPRLGERGRSRALRGLSRDAALSLLGHDLARNLSEEEQLAAARLADDLDGRPTSLRQAAAIVRTGRTTLGEIADRVRRDPSSLDRLSSSGLTDGGRRTLAALAAVAGAALPADVVAVISGVGESLEALGELRNRALVDEREDRFGLPRCAAEARRESLLDYLDLGAAARDLADRLDQGDLTRVDGEAVLEAAVALVGYAAERRDWRAVTQLVRVVEPILTIAGRWEAAIRVLSVAARAASALSDRLAEAHFLHQSGSLALGLGDPETAVRHLTRALDLRRSAADWVGVEVTRRNLSRARASMGAEVAPESLEQVPPLRQRPNYRRRPRFATQVLISLATLGVLGLGVAAIARGTSQSPGPSTSSPTPSEEPSTATRPPRTTPPSASSGQPTFTLQAPVISLGGAPLRAHVGANASTPESSRPFTVRNPNPRSLTLKPIAVTGSQAFSVTNDCPVTLTAAATCTGQVTFDPPDIGSYDGRLSVSDNAGLTGSVQLTGVGYLELTILRIDSHSRATEPVSPDKTVTATLDGRTTTCPDACTVRVSDEAHRSVLLSAAPECTVCKGNTWRFHSWSDPTCGTSTTCNVRVGKDAEVTAVFEFIVG